MKENCLDIGIIQAFLDGELNQAEISMVSRHTAICASCAELLCQAEDETAIVFPALEREFNTLVPTQRLWNKINDSIETERDNRTFWHKVAALITVAFANPSLAAAASLLIVVGIFSVVWINRTAIPADVVVNDAPVTPTRTTLIAPTVNPTNAQPGDEVTDLNSAPAIKAERAAYRTDNRSRPLATSFTEKPESDTSAASSYMPGEESYVKSIASLSKDVEGQKDSIMRPAQRIAYERDMAVVNDAIEKLRNEVKKNPKNESAKQVLYSSYQNKIDLLNSVSQKEELMALR